MDNTAAGEAPVNQGVGRLVAERASAGTLTPEQRARLISSGPNAGRVAPIERCKCGYPMPCAKTVPINFCRA